MACSHSLHRSEERARSAQKPRRPAGSQPWQGDLANWQVSERPVPYTQRAPASVTQRRFPAACWVLVLEFQTTKRMRSLSLARGPLSSLLWPFAAHFPQPPPFLNPGANFPLFSPSHAASRHICHQSPAALTLTSNLSCPRSRPSPSGSGLLMGSTLPAPCASIRAQALAVLGIVSGTFVSPFVFHNAGRCLTT